MILIGRYPTLPRRENDPTNDQMKNYETARSIKAQAIIPMNPQNEKELPTMQAKGHLVFNGGSDDVLGDRKRTFEVSSSTCYRTSGLSFRYDGLLVVQLRNGR